MALFGGKVCVAATPAPKGLGLQNPTKKLAHVGVLWVTCYLKIVFPNFQTLDPPLKNFKIRLITESSVITTNWWLWIQRSVCFIYYTIIVAAVLTYISCLWVYFRFFQDLTGAGGSPSWIATPKAPILSFPTLETFRSDFWSCNEICYGCTRYLDVK